MSREEENGLAGCLTALVTPFNEEGKLDLLGFDINLGFQKQAGITGVVPVGTTGESPALTTEEQILLIVRTQTFLADSSLLCLAGCGSNFTEKTLHLAEIADAIECYGALLVDPYYSGPSTLEIRKEYYERVAKRFPDLMIVPYVIPGRTGCELSVGDLALLAYKYPNISAVKEATGNFERMRETRRMTLPGFDILSGDDDKTFDMMIDPGIEASGVITVIGNIAAVAIKEMCEAIAKGDIEAAQKIREALDPLFKLVTVNKEREEEIHGEKIIIKDKFRNPVPIKTMMQGLGMPAGPCRPSLGKMTSQGVEEVRNALRKVWQDNPWALKPIEEYYEVDIEKRLENNAIWQDLAYAV